MRQRRGRFIQRKCPISFKGKTFTSGGAYCVETKHKVSGKSKDKIFAYTKKLDSGEWVITDWKGNIMSHNAHIFSENKNKWGEPIYGMRFKYNGKLFSGKNYGGSGAYIRANEISSK